jgi:alpha-D-ribose 1-methylphosphonate 5-triphosphate synthase subunit PhnH
MQGMALEGGFDDAPRAASVAFRALMNVMARPGTIEPLQGAHPPAPLSVAAGTLVLTLCDPDTPLHLAGAADVQAVRDWVAFHTGAPLVERAQAVFALGTWDGLLPLEGYLIGTPEYPDRSATLIVEMDRLEASGSVLRGPGIRDTAHLSLPDAAMLARNAALFPLGLDMFFTCGARAAALPRSTRIG